jgi:hypothetical protein
VQHDVDAVGLEIRPDAPQEVTRILADVEIGRIAGIVLALGDLLVVGQLIGLTRGDVADLLEAEVDRIVPPDVDRVPEDRVKCFGHVEVAHAAAGDAGSTRTGRALVQEDDVAARALAACLELHGQMPGCGQPVHPGPDDDVAGGRRQ